MIVKAIQLYWFWTEEEPDIEDTGMLANGITTTGVQSPAGH